MKQRFGYTHYGNKYDATDWCLVGMMIGLGVMMAVTAVVVSIGVFMGREYLRDLISWN